MLRNELFEALCDVAVVDVHSHISRRRMAASDLSDLLYYHMLRYPLRSAGMDDRDLWYRGGGRHFRPDEQNYQAWLAAWPKIESTGFGWIFKTILRDLYGFDEPITSESFPRLRQGIEGRFSQDDWAVEVARRGKVVRILSSARERGDAAPGEFDGMRGTIEVGPGFDSTFETRSWLSSLLHAKEDHGHKVATLAQMRESLKAYYSYRDMLDDKLAYVLWVPSQQDFRPVDESVIDAILAKAWRAEDLTADENRLLSSAVIRCVCDVIRGKIPTFQLCYGTQFLTRQYPRPVQKAASELGQTLGYLVQEYPDIHFNILNGYEPDEPLLCSLVQGYPNVSLGSFWWQTFYPSVMHNAWHRRLDMCPTNRLMAFFSDGYCIDWVYGRLQLTRRVLANVLAEKIEQGFYSKPQALEIGRMLLQESPRQLFLPNETLEPEPPVVPARSAAE